MQTINAVSRLKVSILMGLIFILISDPSTIFATLTSQKHNVLKISANPQNTLKQLSQHIKYLRNTLLKTSQQRKRLLIQLKQNVLSINYVAAEIRQTQKHIAYENLKIRKLNQQYQYYQYQLKKQKLDVAHYLSDAYKLSHKHTPQLLLNLNNPLLLQRLWVDYKYLGKSQLNAIQNLENILNKIKINRRVILNHKNRLQRFKNKLKLNQQFVSKHQEAQLDIIRTINKEIRNKTQQLSELIENKRRLTQLINQLINHKQLAKKDGLFFIKNKGKLPWPTQGTMIHHFGESIDHSQMKWNGIVIKATLGQQVRAIAPGRVVFSDWLPRYGLLIIIDHGLGYLSLYGQNQALYYKVGEWVKSGALIAKVGHTGGQLTPALYFGIWHNRTKLNPEIWCWHKTRKKTHTGISH